jgi:hypothetical protein
MKDRSTAVTPEQIVLIQTSAYALLADLINAAAEMHEGVICVKEPTGHA